MTGGPQPCPTPCDPDCDAGCHEEHQPTWKRDHDPDGHPLLDPDCRDGTCSSCAFGPCACAHHREDP